MTEMTEMTETTEKAGIGLDLMTPTAKKRKERNECIVREFKECAPEIMAQGYKPYRIMDALARKYGVTIPGVRFVLTAAGVYTTSKECVEGIQNAEAEHAEAATEAEAAGSEN